MNRRSFLRGLLAAPAIIPTVSTKTIIDLGANTWRRPKLTPSDYRAKWVDGINAYHQGMFPTPAGIWVMAKDLESLDDPSWAIGSG